MKGKSLEKEETTTRNIIVFLKVKTNLANALKTVIKNQKE
jgi:hypothetical protein